eukprot:TRINITY_DN730_c0_g1_i1.p1 TRINITY_DN730_c0_g1~~TRINITY_DN730_c0_g1_i1.p1  ORF type:complete len:459 (-),score=142.33 TRINITY_DN730_c0_g1_i1:160-1503(-)
MTNNLLNVQFGVAAAQLFTNKDMAVKRRCFEYRVAGQAQVHSRTCVSVSRLLTPRCLTMAPQTRPAPKREAPSSMPPSKRARLCESIAAAISLEEKLPSKCRELLSAMVPGSLGTAPAERHEHQTAAVELLGKALTGVEDALQTDLQVAEAALAKSEEEKAALLNKQGSVEEELSQKQEEVTLKTKVMEAARCAAQASRQAAADADTALVEAESIPKNLQSRKVACETAVAENLAPLMAPGCAGEAEVNAHLAVIMPVCENSEMGFSLLSAVKAAALQAPEARSQFNKMVMSELERELQDYMQVLQSRLTEANEVVRQKKEALEASLAERATCEAAREAADAALDSAKEQAKETEGSLKTAKCSVKDHAPRLAQAHADAKAGRKALADFRGTALKLFRQLEAVQPADDAEEATTAAAGDAATAAAVVADKVAGLPEVTRTPVENLGA